MGYQEDFDRRAHQHSVDDPNRSFLPKNQAERDADMREEGWASLRNNTPSLGGAVMALLMLVGVWSYFAWWHRTPSPPLTAPAPEPRVDSRRPLSPSARDQKVAAPAPTPAVDSRRPDLPRYIVAKAGDAYLAGLPAPETVRREIQGDTPMETAARQAAAFEILMRAMGALMGPRDFVSAQKSPAESALQGAYRTAWKQSTETALKGLGRPEAAAWHQLQISLSVSPAFNRMLLEKTTSEAWHKAHVSNWPAVAAVNAGLPTAALPRNP